MSNFGTPALLTNVYSVLCSTPAYNPSGGTVQNAIYTYLNAHNQTNYDNMVQSINNCLFGTHIVTSQPATLSNTFLNRLGFANGSQIDSLHIKILDTSTGRRAYDSRKLSSVNTFANVSNPSKPIGIDQGAHPGVIGAFFSQNGTYITKSVYSPVDEKPEYQLSVRQSESANHIVGTVIINMTVAA